MTVIDSSQRLGITENNTKVRVHRAIERLVNLISEGLNVPKQVVDDAFRLLEMKRKAEELFKELTLIWSSSCEKNGLVFLSNGLKILIFL